MVFKPQGFPPQSFIYNLILVEMPTVLIQYDLSLNYDFLLL
jgi:hypothetical protein